MQQHQQGSQYGGVSPDMVSFGSAPRAQMLAAGGGSEQAEAASPISSRPPASIMNFDDLGEDTDRAGGGSGISSGNRWPRQETLALLKIRSEMDVAFRDATLKGPLWDEVSRKLGELGYVRSAKKCKEKFENVHKYYKRTKEGRAGRQDGKSYRFFSQLEALQGVATASGSGTTPPLMTTSGPPATAAAANIQFATPVSAVRVGGGGTSSAAMQRGVAPSPQQPFIMYSRDLSMGAGVGVPASGATPVSVAAPPAPAVAPVGISFSSDSTSSGSFDSDENEEEVDDMSEEERPSSNPVGSFHKRKKGNSSRGGNKRRMMDFFEGLMKQVMQKQEAMQQRFLETIEKRELDRMMREEAWKRQETARLSREQELMAQERATAASRDAAIVSFLQKITGQTIPLPQPVSTTISVHQHVAVTPPPSLPIPTMPPAPPSIPSSTTPPTRQQFQQQKLHRSQQQQLQQQQQAQNTDLIRQHQMPPPSSEVIMAVPERQIPPQDPAASGGGGSSSEPASSSRWPKVEVLALIKLRSNLENRYQEAGPKGPLWEEISAGMQRMGYNRSSKRCKEKWENINKYFKKVKESNKKRPEDAKTCPYFYELDAIYQKKLLTGSSSSNTVPSQQQQPQQMLAADQSTTTKHQDTTVSNPGTVQTVAAHGESINKRDGSDVVQPNNEGLPDDIFGDQGGNARAGGGSRKPEDIMMELMKQQEQQQQGEQQLNLDDYDQKMDELGDSIDNVEDSHGEDEDESEEDRKMAYKIEFQRPPTNNKNGGNNGAPSFITMVQ